MNGASTYFVELITKLLCSVLQVTKLKCTAAWFVGRCKMTEQCLLEPTWAVPSSAIAAGQHQGTTRDRKASADRLKATAGGVTTPAGLQ